MKKSIEERLKDIEDVNKDLRSAVDDCDIRGIHTYATLFGSALQSIDPFEENLTPEQSKRYDKVINEQSLQLEFLEQCSCIKLSVLEKLEKVKRKWI